MASQNHLLHGSHDMVLPFSIHSVKNYRLLATISPDLHLLRPANFAFLDHLLDLLSALHTIVLYLSALSDMSLNHDTGKRHFDITDNRRSFRKLRQRFLQLAHHLTDRGVQILGQRVNGVGAPFLTLRNDALPNDFSHVLRVSWTSVPFIL